MKASILPRYGPADVLQVKEVPKPTPGEGAVLIKVRAAAVNKGDWHLVRGRPIPVRLMFGLFRPKVGIPGSDVAGTVEAVGARVTRFRPGDAVFGDLAATGFGAFAEYVCAPESALQPMPGTVTFEQAGAVAMSGAAALQGLRDVGRLTAGEEVLINGASGNVGMLAVQIARALGARVTGVCGVRNVELVRSLGAERVLDYRADDFTAGGPRYDLVLDTAAHRPIVEVVRAIRPGGRYVMVGGSTPLLFRIMLFGRWLGGPGKVRVAVVMQQTRPADLEQLRAWMAEGLLMPVVDRTFSLAEVPDAIRYLTARKARGKLVIVP